MLSEQVIFNEAVRIKFEKTGRLKYISHLDLQRTFSSGLKRARLPLWFSKGFNPHLKMVFALTVSTGTESVCELLDVRLEGECEREYVLERLRASFTGEMKIVDVYAPKRKFSEIRWSEYVLTPNENEKIPLTEGDLEAFKKGSAVITRKTKSGEKTEDIAPMIKDVFLKDNVLHAVLSAAPDAYLSPVYIVKALEQFSGQKIDCHITRTAMYDKDMKIFE